MRYVFLDVESTGLNIYDDEVIQLALLPITINSNSLSSTARVDNFYFRPTKRITPGAYSVHGLTKQKLYSLSATTYKEGFNRVKSILMDADYFCGHNIKAFDIPLLINQTTDVDLKAKLESTPCIDTMLDYIDIIGKEGVDNKYGWSYLPPRLDELVSFMQNNGYGRNIKDCFKLVYSGNSSFENTYHNAAYDCYICYMFFMFMRNKYNDNKV